MTRLKIEVAATNDISVLILLRDLQRQMETASPALRDPQYGAKSEYGNATAEVERDGDRQTAPTLAFAAMMAVGDALGELESQAVNLHLADNDEAKARNKTAQECLGKAMRMLDTLETTAHEARKGAE